MRTSTFRVTVPPRRSIVRSWITRRVLPCTSLPNSAISSRKMVPPSANSNLPACRAWAPV